MNKPTPICTECSVALLAAQTAGGSPIWQCVQCNKTTTRSVPDPWWQKPLWKIERVFNKCLSWLVVGGVLLGGYQAVRFFENQYRVEKVFAVFLHRDAAPTWKARQGFLTQMKHNAIVDGWRFDVVKEDPEEWCVYVRTTQYGLDKTEKSEYDRYKGIYTKEYYTARQATPADNIPK